MQGKTKNSEPSDEGGSPRQETHQACATWTGPTPLAYDQPRSRKIYIFNEPGSSNMFLSVLSLTKLQRLFRGQNTFLPQSIVKASGAKLFFWTILINFLRLLGSFISSPIFNTIILFLLLRSITICVGWWCMCREISYLGPQFQLRRRTIRHILMYKIGRKKD